MIDTLHRFIHGEITQQEELQLLEWLRNPANQELIQTYYRQQWDSATSEFSPEVGNRLFKQIVDKITKHEHSLVTQEQPKKKARLLKRYLRIVAATAAAILFAVISFMSGSDSKEALLAKVEMEECYVNYGSREEVILPDGSVVWLNAGSVLIYPQEFKGATRSVYLSGEGNFSVKSDKQKPFIVQTKHLDVEALGTIFCIESYPGSGQTTATLEQGSIRVSYNSISENPTILSPDQRLVYDHSQKSVRKLNVDASQYLSWVDGYLVFKDETFDRIISRLERQFSVTVNYSPDKFQGKRFFLHFVPKESIEEILSVFSSVAGGFKYTIRNTEITIR